ncbi:flagellar export chaperone FliS [Treponema primitia]|uniref:flagellar export chaperone FliS n=1 Tax=Treponema primitia TaxID=88058 RepID=UPI000255593D|nr:flagellar export chaperone FliS [Treponema primitia]
MAKSNQIFAYTETRIKTASQGQLIIMLYNEAVKQLDHGLELLERNAGGKKNPGRIEQISKSILKTQEIVTELMASLDFDQGGDIAKNLFSLYTWFNQELLAANINHDPQRISSVRNMLNDLRSAWSEIITKNSMEGIGHPAVGLNITG